MSQSNVCESLAITMNELLNRYVAAMIDQHGIEDIVNASAAIKANITNNTKNTNTNTNNITNNHGNNGDNGSADNIMSRISWHISRINELIVEYNGMRSSVPTSTVPTPIPTSAIPTSTIATSSIPMSTAGSSSKNTESQCKSNSKDKYPSCAIDLYIQENNLPNIVHKYFADLLIEAIKDSQIDKYIRNKVANTLNKSIDNFSAPVPEQTKVANEAARSQGSDITCDNVADKQFHPGFIC